MQGLAEIKDNPTLDTREKIFLVARKLFAAYGFEETSIRDITNSAGVNVASVTYHFGGKKELYLEVIRERASAYQSARMKALAPALEGKATLQEGLKAFVEICLSSTGGLGIEEDLTIFFREIYAPGPGFPVIMKEMVGPTKQAVLKIFKRDLPGISEEKATLCLGSIMAQIYHFSRLNETATKSLGFGGDTLKTNRLAEHIVTFSLHGILGQK